MRITQLLLKELEQEAETTRKMLALVPEDKFTWQPHPKSMTLIRLATHVAELPGWVTMVMTTEELDFAKNPYQPEKINSAPDLLAFQERSQASGVATLNQAQDEQLWTNWVLRNGNEIYSNTSKYEFVRLSMAQIIHHRAQLGVYLRLLNIPIPGSYGPSADELGL